MSVLKYDGWSAWIQCSFDSSLMQPLTSTPGCCLAQDAKSDRPSSRFAHVINCLPGCLSTRAHTMKHPLHPIAHAFHGQMQALEWRLEHPRGRMEDCVEFMLANRLPTPPTGLYRSKKKQKQKHKQKEKQSTKPQPSKKSKRAQQHNGTT